MDIISFVAVAAATATACTAFNRLRSARVAAKSSAPVPAPVPRVEARVVDVDLVAKLVADEIVRECAEASDAEDPMTEGEKQNMHAIQERYARLAIGTYLRILHKRR